MDTDLYVNCYISYSYAYACRYFNGDLREDINATCTVMWGASQILAGSTNDVFQTVPEAVAVVRNNFITQRVWVVLRLNRFYYVCHVFIIIPCTAVQNTHTRQSFSAFCVCLTDVATLLSSPTSTLAALSDIYRIFESSTTLLQNRKLAFSTSKKVYFYLSWVNSDAVVKKTLSVIGRQITAECQKVQDEWKQVEISTADMEKVRKQVLEKQARDDAGGRGHKIVEWV
jgi:hypothetical protein